MKKQIALTFDDGPNTTTTVQVLDKLRKYGIIASFFLIANNITPESEKMVRKAHDMGCEIDNHSKTHAHMDTLDADTIREEIRYTSERIFELTGEMPRFFRPPFIDVNETMVENIDLPFICGHGGRDWEPDVDAATRASLILDSVRDGSIILLHDMTGNDRTVEALDTIIPALQKQDYEFVTVTELFEKKNIRPTVHSGIVYSDVTDTRRYSD
ncbi:MAG: polysaccharide deacetylase family protein [Lachnospiraceae bacterium]|nr:polysaccharide deacetylase family protein [Lachnospiraceae bacterium]